MVELYAQEINGPEDLWRN